MYLPEQHHQVMRPLLAQIGCAPTFKSEYESPASSDTSFTELQFSPMQGFAMLLLDRAGKDWDSQLRKKFFSWAKICTVSISIPAWKPLPPCLDEKWRNSMESLQAVTSCQAQSLTSYTCFCLSRSTLTQ
ncbi:GNAT family N-acetyltransferase [Aduncisulcus paluster]|uniref:GNAT family N-acetyltransferase n=1 Tax=Aduncisulcus paluster TaxID=2918883 RepID=A0ABQ5K9Z8_9EUKA|nr:GNAT family N-acetyltransferase [Aduncisulcus paluster]